MVVKPIRPKKYCMKKNMTWRYISIHICIYGCLNCTDHIKKVGKTLTPPGPQICRAHPVLPNPNPSHLGFEDIVDGFLKGLEHGRKFLEKSPFKRGRRKLQLLYTFTYMYTC